MTTYYKFLRDDGASPFQGHPWPLPTADAPGDWLPAVKGRLKQCGNGYHLSTLAGWRHWRDAAMYEVEVADGAKRLPLDEHDQKLCTRGPVRLVRRVEAWNDRTLRLFAADCAEHTLHLFEQRYPGDTRPRQAIAVARRYARGEATADELRQAYHAAAAYAAYAAAAAYAADAYAAADAAAAAADAAAAYAADAAADAAYAAADAAADAAYAAYAADAAAAAYAADAAADAKRAEARAVERAWQDARLRAYLFEGYTGEAGR